MYGMLRGHVKRTYLAPLSAPSYRDQPTLNLKIVFLTAGGPFGLLALESLMPDHEISMVVRPLDTSPVWKRVARIPARALRLRHRDVVHDSLRETDIPSIDSARLDDGALARSLLRAAPDLICIATFPWLLMPDILAIPRHGVINLHPSYLPRHRGPNPIFWTYYHGDRTGGVSAHLANSHADAGPILVQERIDIPRGWPSDQLYLAQAALGAKVLHAAVESIERGTARPVPQPDHLSTSAPRVTSGTPMIDFTSWGVERIWHYLAGLNPWYKEALTSMDGRLVRYGDVLGFERGRPEGRTGRARPTRHGWTLSCRDGEVNLGRRSLLPNRVRLAPTAPT